MVVIKKKKKKKKKKRKKKKKKKKKKKEKTKKPFVDQKENYGQLLIAWDHQTYYLFSMNVVNQKKKKRKIKIK